MSALRNPRHERFAQALIEGKSATAAYDTIYSKKDRAAASRLQRRPDILQRVADLLAEREAIQSEATARAIESVAYDKEAMFRDLLTIKERAMGSAPAKEGEEASEFQGNVAKGALELYAKLAGWLVERREVKQDTVINEERKSVRERVAEIVGEEASGDATASEETLH